MSAKITRPDFIARYGGIYEHAVWVAEKAWDSHAGAAEMDIAARAAHMADCVNQAPYERQLELLRAHPELAVTARTDLTASSAAEQNSLGLNDCAPEEAALFADLNQRYRKKFGFPFIIAVKLLKTREEILSAMKTRLENSPEQEFLTAISQVHHIARLRLNAL